MSQTPSSTETAYEKMDTAEKEVVISEGILLLVTILAVSLFAAHICKKYRRVNFIQLPVIATVLGIVTGAVLKFGLAKKNILEKILAFDTDIFFVLLLPPIIFESGFNLTGQKGEYFFNNFGTILWFALFATATSFVIIGTCMYILGLMELSAPLTVRECFAFGALISSTDPIAVLGLIRDMRPHPTIESVVAGEALLNDAISIVLYRTISNAVNINIAVSTISFIAVFCSSLTIGTAVGLFSALVYRLMDLLKEGNPILESSLLVLLAWSSYLISEGFSQSGIVSILFCGITMAKYTVPNLSDSAKEGTMCLVKTMAMVAESTVFILLGIAVFSFPFKFEYIGLYPSTLSVVTGARVMSVALTAYIVNLFRNRPMSAKPRRILMLSGFRGAIAFSLSLRAYQDFRSINGNALQILNATLAYALFTIIVGGLTIKWLFDRFNLIEEFDEDSVEVDRVGEGICGKLKRGLIMVDERILQRVLRNRYRIYYLPSTHNNNLYNDPHFTGASSSANKISKYIGTRTRQNVFNSIDEVHTSRELRVVSANIPLTGVPNMSQFGLATHNNDSIRSHPDVYAPSAASLFSGEVVDISNEEYDAIEMYKKRSHSSEDLS